MLLRRSWIGYTLLVALLLAGCTPVPPGVTQLSLTNTIPLDIDRIVVIFPQQRLVFGPIRAGATTAYQPVARGVYGYAAYEITLDGRVITQPVTDWVGEQPLPDGRYTYALAIDPDVPDGQRIQATVQRD